MVRMLVTTACITVIRHAHLLKREMTPHALAHRRPCGALAALTDSGRVEELRFVPVAVAAEPAQSLALRAAHGAFA
jgi:hypothetical protein